MYVSHVYLSSSELTSQGIWILLLLLALWIQIKEENVCGERERDSKPKLLQVSGHLKND